uniref:Tumor protein p63 regulated 1 n=1 Tax=Dicentrarchus labrax TaxID=13489 RepID=A0A8C4HLH8_DICLA
MLEAEEEGMPSEEQQHQLSSSSGGQEDTQPAEGGAAPSTARTEGTEERAAESRAAPSTARTEGTEERPAEGGAAPSTARTEGTEERAAEGRAAPSTARTEGTEERAVKGGAAPSQYSATSVESSLEQFKLRRFFVLRPGTLNQAIKDIEALVDKEVDGNVRSIWLMAEREGEGVRIFWDRLREPTFTSKWNPFATDFPFITFTYHPVKNISDSLADLCDIHNFREQLKDAAQKVHALKPVPGKANGVLVLKQPIQIEAYVGLMSFLGNQNKLGYCMARGNLGF